MGPCKGPSIKRNGPRKALKRLETRSVSHTHTHTTIHGSGSREDHSDDHSPASFPLGGTCLRRYDCVYNQASMTRDQRVSEDRARFASVEQHQQHRREKIWSEVGTPRRHSRLSELALTCRVQKWRWRGHERATVRHQLRDCSITWRSNDQTSRRPDGQARVRLGGEGALTLLELRECQRMSVYMVICSTQFHQPPASSSSRDDVSAQAACAQTGVLQVKCPCANCFKSGPSRHAASRHVVALPRRGLFPP